MAERWLGLGVLLTAGLGYMVMMFSMALRPGADPSLARLLTGILVIGWVCHNLGVLCSTQWRCLR